MTLPQRVCVQHRGMHGLSGEQASRAVSLPRGLERLLGGARSGLNAPLGKDELSPRGGRKPKGAWLAGDGCTSADQTAWLGGERRELRPKQHKNNPTGGPDEPLQGSYGQRGSLESLYIENEHNQLYPRLQMLFPESDWTRGDGEILGSL